MTEQERIAKVVAHALWAIRVYLGTGYNEEYPERFVSPLAWPTLSITTR